MAERLVISYDDVEAANKALTVVVELEKDRIIQTARAAVVKKSEDGRSRWSPRPEPPAPARPWAAAGACSSGSSSWCPWRASPSAASWAAGWAHLDAQKAAEAHEAGEAREPFPTRRRPGGSGPPGRFVVREGVTRANACRRQMGYGVTVKSPCIV